MASIINGLFAGRSGISSHGAAISVLADNIANANTTGFKASRADFADLIAGNIRGAGSTDSGSGSTTQAITQIFNQGTFEFTGRGLDVGIDGNGFFVVSDGGTRYFTRAGNFQVDANGNLLNQNGYQVLGYPSNGAGGLEALNVNSVAQSTVSSGAVTITGNLNASAPIGAVPGAGSTFAQLNNAADFSTFVDVFDSLGASHTVSLYFFHTGAGQWTVNAYADGSEVSGGTAGLPSLLGTSTISFNPDGSRVADPDGVDFNINTTWSSGAAAADIDFAFDPFTQFATASSVQSISQDGKGSGTVTSFSVESDGTLFALLDNGQTQTIGTIALASFANPEGLRRIGNSLYANTSDSGQAVIGQPSTGQFGGLESGALELSTADIASDFVKLISLQRGFQGSSRIITAIDELLSEIVNLAR